MIFLVDKPAGMTSQRVVSAIKHASSVRLKIGHTGTLDPMCTGLLPVLTGNDTKLTPFLPAKKSYRAVVRFGLKTNTGDVTGNTVETSHLPDFSRIPEVLSSFVGQIEQIPPMYSAVHLNGRRLYELAREGVAVERPARSVTVFSVTPLGSVGETDYAFEVECSAGTYIRTLCEDLGGKLGVCATMASLRRLTSNGFSLENAVSLDEMIRHFSGGTEADLAVSSESACSFYPALTVPRDGLRYYLNGGSIAVSRFSPIASTDGIYRAYSSEGVFLGLTKADGGVGKAVFFAISRDVAEGGY